MFICRKSGIHHDPAIGESPQRMGEKFAGERRTAPSGRTRPPEPPTGGADFSWHPRSPAVTHGLAQLLMENFLIQYGLLAVLCCALIENDVTFILTGVIIHHGIVHPTLGVVYCVAGALGHDLLWFWLGHSKSASIRQSRVYRRVGPLVERLADRFGAWELFLCRFIYGTRNPSLVFWGAHRLPLWKFLAVETIALLVWGSFLAALGFFLSDRATFVIGKVKSFEHLLLGFAIVVLIVVVGLRMFARYEIRKRLPPPPEEL